MKGIADIMLQGIIKRSREQLGITLSVDTAARDYLIDKGYDDKYGARPLRRTIQNLLEDKLVEVGLEGEDLSFSVKKKAVPRKKSASGEIEKQVLENKAK